VVRVNGRVIDGRGATRGRYVYFFVCGKGRFVATLERVAGLDMLPGKMNDPRVIRFTAGGDRYEWVSGEPFVAGSPRVWVWHDREHRCPPGVISGLGSGPDLGNLRPRR
jgi:hypothetical protein